jgi:hypothetical protein
MIRRILSGLSGCGLSRFSWSIIVSSEQMHVRPEARLSESCLIIISAISNELAFGFGFTFSFSFEFE